MFCPECNLENHSSAKFCVHCGSVLTQAELTAPSANRTNQVWNTEIEQEQNRKNSRTAMIALGAVIVLILALAVCVWIALPSMGDALIGERADGERFTDRLSDFWDDFMDSFDWDGRSPEPEPGAFAAIQGEADEEFLELLETYLKKDYELDTADTILLPDKYVGQFEALLTADFADEELVSYTITMVSALRSMRDSVDYSSEDSSSYIADYSLWLAGYTTLCSIARDMYYEYGILMDESHIPTFYVDMFPICEVALMAEQDLAWQLIDIEPQWSPIHNCYTISYTNCTEYEMDITFYFDYEIEDEYLHEEQTIEGIMPDERIVIALQEMPDDYVNWYIDWIVEDYYIDGTSIFEYDW